MEWVRQQGPWCPALHEYLERNQQNYDVLIFFTYPVRADAARREDRASEDILVPTAHDEPAIHLDIYKELFSAPAGIAYNTDVERRFLTTHFSIRAIEEETVGCGVDLPQSHLQQRERPEDADDSDGPAQPEEAPDEDRPPAGGRTWPDAASSFAVVTGCMARWPCMAGASIRGRDARS